MDFERAAMLLGIMDKVRDYPKYQKLGVAAESELQQLIEDADKQDKPAPVEELEPVPGRRVV